MPNIWLPLISISVMLAVVGIAYLVLSKKEKQKRKQASAVHPELQRAQEFINIKTIDQYFLHTTTNQVFLYLRISPVSIDLLSKREQKNLANTLTAEISGERKPFKFLALSRVADISPQIERYARMIQETNDRVRKELLREESLFLNQFSMSGERPERQFFLAIWEPAAEDAEQQLLKRGREWISRLESVKIHAHLLKKAEIINLCSMITNPSFAHYEDGEIDATIPVLDQYSKEGRAHA